MVGGAVVVAVDGRHVETERFNAYSQLEFNGNPAPAMGVGTLKMGLS